jgi:DNA-binding MarR family transcriptional regulator
MSDRRPLPVLLSQVLGAMTAELEGTETRSYAAWCNVLRCIGDGIEERELPTAARISSRLATAWVTKTAREGLISAKPQEGTKNRRLELTDAGCAATKAFAERLGPLDAKWRKSRSRSALERLVSQFRFELPHFPASYGAADPSAIGGPYMQGRQRKNDLPAHGNDWKPVMRGDGDTVSSLPITALLSQALMAFTIDYEDRFPWPLANTATVLHHITKEPRPLADLPEGHGIVGKGKSLLERHLIVSVTPDPEDKRKMLVGLTDRGEQVLKHHPQRLEVVEKDWNDRYGDTLIAELRDALTEAVGDLDESYPDYVTAPLY